jgi:tetratricopeptide (TPR) repeat protein
MTIGTPGLQEAVTACSDKLQSLKQREDAQWTTATSARDARNCAGARQAFTDLLQKHTPYQLKAREEIGKLASCTESAGPSGNGSCTDAASNLQKADGAVRTGNWTVARNLLTPITSCPGYGPQAKTLLDTVERTDTNNRLHTEALLAIRLNKYPEACVKLNQIEATDPAYKGLAADKASAGGCPQQAQPVQQVAKLDEPSKPRSNDGGKAVPAPAPGDTKSNKGDDAKPKDALKDKYDQAVRLKDTAKYSEAIAAFNAIKKQDPNYQDVNDLLKDAQAELKKINEGSADQRAAALKQQAQAQLNKGEFVAASGLVSQALQLKPDDAAAKQLQQQINDAKAHEDTDLLAGIDAYYAGKYPDAQTRLEEFLKKQHAVRITAIARFYSGAAVASQFYLTGATDNAKKEAAKQAFAQTIKLMPAFLSQMRVEASISPKITRLFLEATGKQ